MDFETFSRHFPTKNSARLNKYIRDVALAHSRYLFVWREGPVQMAYCTHCEAEYPIGRGSFYFKHNEETKCLNCNSAAQVKSAGRGRSNLYDDAFVMWYEKSRINRRAIVARWLHVSRRYSGDFRKVKTEITARAMYLFEPSVGDVKGQAYGFSQGFDGWQWGWKQQRTPHSMLHQAYGTFFRAGKPVFCSYKDIKRVVKGTPFQYSTWEHYTDETFDLVGFFVLAAKYPCIEYLTKLGFRGLVQSKLRGLSTHGAINWNGKTIEKVLKLTKTEIQELRKVCSLVTPDVLHAIQVLRHKHPQFSVNEAYLLREVVETYLNLVPKTVEETGLREDEVLRYALRQMQRPGASKYFSGARAVFRDWQDYRAQCKELGIELSRPHLLSPNDLHKAHQKTIRKVKLKADQLLNERIAKRLPSLSKFEFSDGNLFIRPAHSSIELFDEGKALNHCVGSYADRYASGQTTLFVIRKVAEPDKPFFTLEARIGQSLADVVQCRGKNNCSTTKEVENFVDLFVSKKLLTKNRRRVGMAG